MYLFLLALSNGGKPVLKKRFIKCGNIYRLELGGLNSQFLKRLIDGENPSPDIKTNKLLKECLGYFASQILSFGKLDDLSKYLQKITFSLEFVVQDQTLAVKAFESLNDRGKPLTLLDKTKSYLMFVSLRYLNNKLNEQINTVFGNVFTNYDIIKEIGEQENIDYIRSVRFTEDELLRFFYHYFAYYSIKKYDLPVGYNYDATANEVFEIFLKKSCNHLKMMTQDLEKLIEEFLGDLDKFATSFREIIGKVKIDCRIKKMFSFLGLNTRIYPLFISLKTENLLDNSMLDLLETLDLRIYKIRGTDPRADLYRDVISQIKVNPNRQQIIDGGNNLIGIKDFIQRFMDDAEFQHSLNKNLHGNPAVKYILWEYEKHLDSSFDDCDYELYRMCQIEHIFPEKHTLRFPAYQFSDERDYVANIHRLGNLCLLEEKINKRIQNKIPQNKSKDYQQSAIPRTKQLGYNISNKGFYKGKNIDKITNEIIDFCLKRWNI
ncbi:MAG: HNH endonuclease [Deltaproteobacteria bacterium]|nr:HNH endonuclease [Deltaproteobacteria bacterium]